MEPKGLERGKESTRKLLLGIASVVLGMECYVKHACAQMVAAGEKANGGALA